MLICKQYQGLGLQALEAPTGPTLSKAFHTGAPGFGEWVCGDGFSLRTCLRQAPQPQPRNSFLRVWGLMGMQSFDVLAVPTHETITAWVLGGLGWRGPISPSSLACSASVESNSH